LGLITNLVWALILAARQWLPHSWRFWHLDWLPAHEGTWPGIVNFFTLDSPHLFSLWVGGFAAVMLVMTTLTGVLPHYIEERRGRTSEWEYARQRAERAGRGFFLGVGILFVSGIALFCLAESLLFIAGTIYNISVAHPLLTPFAGAWGN
jgi:hypothetical protein